MPSTFEDCDMLRSEKRPQAARSLGKYSSSNICHMASGVTLKALPAGSWLHRTKPKAQEEEQGE